MSMFSETTKEKPCTTVEECVRRDKVADHLWAWADRLDTLGTVLFLLLLVGGAIVSWQIATAARDGASFWISLIGWALCAFIEYCLYHCVALLIGALAGIYQNTKTTARLQEYQLRNLAAGEAALSKSAQSAETVRDVAQAVAQVEQKEAVPVPVAAPSESPRGYDTVRCPQCGRSQSDARDKCYQCGAPLKTE